MPAAPFLPAGDHHRPNLELDARTGERPHNGPVEELVPKRIRLAVVHQLVRAIEEARGAEDEGLGPPRHLGLEKDARAAQRAVGERHGHPADHVVEHLVPIEDAQRIGARITLNLDAEHELVVAEVGGVGGGNVGGVDQGRDAVLAHPAPDNLFEAIKTGTPRACNGAVSDQVGTNIHNHTEMPRTNCLLSPLKNTLRPNFASSVSR